MATQFGTESGREFLDSVNALPGQVSPNDTFIPTDYSDPHRVELEREVFLAEKKFEANPSKENEQALSNANLALTEHEEYIVIMNSTDEFTDSVRSDGSGYR
ncbi:hypothetical protein [Limnobacter parvus]|uniref:Uncharacterized protein n=1 Tax=Limnobacter parvus TaxID=2939690 RepID=A0ABT1XGQ9_9BURK|nr:hypothetical protein [Limnobacter parvus]MCR2746467.1 hypothetical protein [Limnobacter parvus]